MSIGLKIKELARQNNITLANLAKRLGKTKQAIYEMVDKEDVNTLILRKLSNEFNVPISYFFDDAVCNATVNGNNSVSAVNSRVSVNSDASEKKIEELTKLLAEKEKLLAEREKFLKTYEELIEFYKRK